MSSLLSMNTCVPHLNIYLKLEDIFTVVVIAMEASWLWLPCGVAVTAVVIMWSSLSPPPLSHALSCCWVLSLALPVTAHTHAHHNPAH